MRHSNERDRPREHKSTDSTGIDLSALLLAALVLVIALWLTHEFWLPVVWPN